MKQSTTKKAIIIGSEESKILSAGQKTFNRLIKKIKLKRQLLTDWQEVVPAYREKYASAFEPLMEEYNDRRKDLALLLDNYHEKHAFTKKQRDKLVGAIQSIIGELITSNQSKYEPLKPIYNKHSTSDYDEESAEEISQMKAMMEASLGIELDDNVDFASPEEVMLNIAKKMQEQLGEKDRAKENRKKTAKQLEKEQKQQEETTQMSQSIREIFRKLAQALHPDKIKDSAEKERRHELMQRVNVAYNKQDLLTLLELQLEVEHIDEKTINAMAEDRLKHYTKVLNEQVKELEAEIDMNRHGISLKYNVPLSILKNSPHPMLFFLEHEISKTKSHIDDVKSLLVELVEVNKMKAWLKEMPSAPVRSRIDDFMPNW